MEIGPLLLCLAVMFILARFGARVISKYGVPGLIGEIIVGIVVANLSFGDWSFLDMMDIVIGDDLTDSSDNYEAIYLFAELGVIFLLFTVGLETKVNDLLSVGKAAMLVAVLGVLFPFVLGYGVIIAMGGDIGTQEHAMFMGAAMVATSVGITARVIKDMKLIDTHESRIIIGAAVIDDILGMIVLAIVVGMADTGEISISNIASITIMAVVFVLVMLAVAKWVCPRIHEYFATREKKYIARTGKTPMRSNKLIIAIIVCFFFSWFADNIGLAAIIGAFLGGMLLADYAWEWGLEEKIESITTLFISFFFLNVGMQVDLGECANITVIGMALLFIVLAVITKYYGCGLGARLGDKSLDAQSRKIIGIGMIPRGEVGIIVASYGLASGAMTNDLYAIVIIMAVATTIIAPPLLSKAFRKKYPEEYTITPADKM